MSAQHQQDDQWLMFQVAQGSRDHLETLIRRYATPLTTFLRRLAADPHQAEELLQEVFLTVWKHRSRYGYPLPFRPWLYKIALNKFRESFRGPARHMPMSRGELVMDVTETHTAGPAEAAVAAETAALVVEAVAELPLQQRAVLTMRVWNDLPFDEIGEALGCTAGTARSHMHHALNLLRKKLEPRMR